MDTLFRSFNASISVANFAELSACVFSWLEEHCKPQVCVLDRLIGISSTHCGLLMPYGNIDLGQHWLITVTNFGFSLVRFCGIHPSCYSV